MAGQARIFMSYRREDSADVSGRIYDALAAHFGDEAIFKDVDDIPFGVNFKTHLNNVIRQSAVELVVIGPRWLDAKGEDGYRRLDNPADFVRIEIEAALSQGMPVIPLLVSGARMPPGNALPAAMAELAYRNGIAVRPDPDFHNDMRRLIKALEEHVRPQKRAAGPAAQPAPAATPTPARPSPPAERVLYQKAGDRVTNLVARVDGKSYPIADLQSASAGKLQPKNVPTRITPGLIIAAFSCIGFFALASSGNLETAASAGTPLGILALGLLGASVVLYVFEITKHYRRRHTVTVVDSSGKKVILVSQDKQHVQALANAINEARALRAR